MSQEGQKRNPETMVLGVSTLVGLILGILFAVLSNYF